MIIKHPEKHLTDQEFYTLIKFFDLFIEKKGLDDEENFHISHFGIGSNEEGTIFNDLFMSAQVLEVEVDIEEGYQFSEQLEQAKAEAEGKPEKEKKELLKILRKIKAGKKTKITEIATVSWIWYEIYKHIKFSPSECKIPKEIEKVL